MDNRITHEMRGETKITTFIGSQTPPRFQAGQTRYTYNPMIGNTEDLDSLELVIEVTLRKTSYTHIPKGTSFGYGGVLAVEQDNEETFSFHPFEVPPIMEESWTIDEARENQRQICLERQVSSFIPPNGYCWNCNQQVYKLRSGRGYLTSCPHCNVSGQGKLPCGCSAEHKFCAGECDSPLKITIQSKDIIDMSAWRDQ